MKNLLSIILIAFLAFDSSAQVYIGNNTAAVGGTVGFQLFGTSTQWDDVVTPALLTKVNPATSLPALNLDSVALEFVRDPDSSEIAYYSIQLPHRVRYATTAYCAPHYHYTQTAIADTTYQMVLMYRIQKIGAVNGSWIRITTADRAVLPYTSGAVHQIGSFAHITLNNVSESSYIDFKMYRNDAAGNPATLFVKGFDVHFEFEKLGTPDEYPSH